MSAQANPRRAGAASSAAENLTLAEAQALATIASRLDRRPRPSRDPAVQRERLLETIRGLGCVQLDTISVVSRSHETVLWSRLGNYDPAVLASLHHPEGLVTEYWAHAAAIIPIETFPHYRHAMDAYREKYERPGSWAGADPDLELVEGVLTRIRENGAMASRHFERPDRPRSRRPGSGTAASRRGRRSTTSGRAATSWWCAARTGSSASTT